MKHGYPPKGHAWYYDSVDYRRVVIKCFNCKQSIEKKITKNNSVKDWSCNSLIDCKTKQAELKMDEALK